METVKCIKERRSVRKFDTSREVSRELIDSVIDVSRFSPSWKNTQVTRYTVLTGDSKNALADCTNTWAGNGDIMRSAPMVVALSIVDKRSGYERDGSPSTPLGNGWQMFDCGISAQSFCLAAFDAGLSTVIMGLYDDNAAEVIGIPEGQILTALIAVGYAAEDPAAPKRKELSDLVTYKN
ncbi:MAG: nitroreductase family protein [Lachnospiraceae bacterium]|nr:nitroreductase family protein [Lachnospiraceae bacterium]